ncbi:hypothetical protein [Bdellovibrio sp. GT3]|uniref:hypothetical protein n=1 Tax=Bdellovibrio sp. GT3 TaxID=3136282 RepID=UPI0030F090B7
MKLSLIIATLLSAFVAANAFAEVSDLEKELANPFANLTTLPLQYNFYTNTAKSYQTQTVFNVQPVFAAQMSESWSLVNRVIIPTVTSPLADGTDSASGVSDLIYQGFYVPNTSGPWAFGYGAMIALPTGADERISSGKFGAGPALGIVHTSEYLSVGGLIYQNWSFAGDDDRKDVNLLTIQPLLSYRMGGGWSFSPLNNITYDATLNGEQWTVPVGISFTKLLLRKAVPLNLVFGAFGRVVHPDGAPDVEGKAQMNLVF